MGNSSDLELYTSEELIQELLNRTTVVGIFIRSDKDAKGITSQHQCFKVDSSPNLNQEQIATILDGVANQIKT